MGMIYEKLKPCPICGQSVLGLKCEYRESFAYIQCNHCRYDFAARNKFEPGSSKMKSNAKDTIRLWNAFPRLQEAEHGD